MTPKPGLALDDIRPEVTDHDRHIYAVRAEIADQSREAYYEAIAALGSGYDDYAVWWCKDRLGIAPDQRFYCARGKDGPGWKPDIPVRFQYERAPGIYFKRTDGAFLACAFRWITGIAVIDHRYAPKTPEELAIARATRQRKELLKAADDMPLFREQVLEGRFPFSRP